ncbi:TIGR03620 family F420-dependent LLM class oxidoreductase [Agromyces ramosus]|uniref:F420-dependent oxidoreductase n=1 Tax=Agromyces ramosus TaxID=33879 RepID=A0ABU0RDA4_9MICO|nr:TIGR03620 family F420-dependent LLM class oxidoreductase [Agromyces ramosus]MDQ0896048.1 putative F420-dependent oxidoreductase [Agromyces ramosus]
MQNDMASVAPVGRLGIWSLELRGADKARIHDAAAALDSQGWSALWIAGANGPGLWPDAEGLLSAAPHTSVAFGVMSIWSPDARIAIAEHPRLVATYGKRLILGLGVSTPQTAAAVGAEFGSPLTAMNRYLDELDAAKPALNGDRILGALGPRMVALARNRAAGIHPFLVTPESSNANRAILGPDALIAPHQAVVLETNPVKARAIARRGIGMFIGLPSYQANLRRLGFGDDDLVPGGSDRLIDATVAWGSLDDIHRRIRDHWGAGADHVALHVLSAHGRLPTAEWQELSALIPS